MKCARLCFAPFLPHVRAQAFLVHDGNGLRAGAGVVSTDPRYELNVGEALCQPWSTHLSSLDLEARERVEGRGQSARYVEMDQDRGMAHNGTTENIQRKKIPRSVGS